KRYRSAAASPMPGRQRPIRNQTKNELPLIFPTVPAARPKKNAITTNAAPVMFRDSPPMTGTPSRRSRPRRSGSRSSVGSRAPAARTRTPRPPPRSRRPARTSDCDDRSLADAQLFPDQAVHLGSVGAALGLLHHGADDRACRLDLAVPDLLH